MPKTPICKCSHLLNLHTFRGCQACKDCERFDERYCARCMHRSASHEGDCVVPGCACLKDRPLTDRVEGQMYERAAKARRDRRRACERAAGWSEGAHHRTVYRRFSRGQGSQGA